MSFVQDYATSEPPRQDIDALPGVVLLEFGNSWCGHCRRAEPLIKQALAEHDGVEHMRFADASGKRLGRSFGVKLWPTFVFLKDGQEVARLVRPVDMPTVQQAFSAFDPN